MRLKLTAGLIALALAAGPALTAQSLRADDVDNYIRSEMAARHLPGISVAIVQGGAVVKMQGYGFADVERKTPAGPKTVYGLGSCTKPFTAVAVMQLAEAGKVSLDAPISRYLPGLPAAWNAITVRELLTHTSGLTNYRLHLDYDHLAQYRNSESVISLLKSQPLDFSPGTKYAYSNTNYHLLGMIVEKASGQSYEAYLADRQFRPAGMAATRLADPSAKPPAGLAAGYLWDGRARSRNTLIFPQAINFGDSGLLSTVGDLAKWDEALANGRLLTAASLREMETAGKLADGTPIGCGLGWIITSYQGHRLIGHSGAEPGYSSSLFRFPDDHLIVIVLGNVFDGTPLTDSLAGGVAARFLTRPATGAAPAVDPEPETTALLRGVLTELAAGRVDRARFTPAMTTLLTPDIIAKTNRNLSSLGALQSLTFLTRAEGNGRREYHYRAIYGSTPVLFVLTLTADGRIGGLTPSPE